MQKLAPSEIFKQLEAGTLDAIIFAILVLNENNILIHNIFKKYIFSKINS